MPTIGSNLQLGGDDPPTLGEVLRYIIEELSSKLDHPDIPQQVRPEDFLSEEVLETTDPEIIQRAVMALWEGMLSEMDDDLTLDTDLLNNLPLRQS
jgi:hypothetical protein